MGGYDDSKEWGEQAALTFESYEQRASALDADLPQRELDLKNALGLAEESGEVVSLIRKHFFNARVLDADLLKKELGDVLWYIVNLAKGKGLTLRDVAMGNLRKLEARYPQGKYSHEACAARADEKLNTSALEAATAAILKAANIVDPKPVLTDSPVLIQCYRCKRLVPRDMTRCLVGVGTQCIDQNECRFQSQSVP